jgi:hypothetical protein
MLCIESNVPFILMSDCGSPRSSPTSRTESVSSFQLLILGVIFCAVIGGGISLAAHLNGGFSMIFSGKDGPCDSSCKNCPVVAQPTTMLTNLPIPEIESRNTEPWFITTDLTNQPISVIEINGTKAMRAEYQAGLYGSASGPQFRFNPEASLPAETFVLSYQAYFPADFPWAKGGKLPGLCISAEWGGCATGGRWGDSTGSFRPVWREKGRLIGYAYLPLQRGDAGKDFGRISDPSEDTGIKLWCKNDGGLRLYPNEWVSIGLTCRFKVYLDLVERIIYVFLCCLCLPQNNITIYISLGNPGMSDGIVALWANGAVRIVRDVAWRLSEQVEVSAGLFATFFGGGDPTWAVPSKTYALFRNFAYARNVVLQLVPNS